MTDDTTRGDAPGDAPVVSQDGDVAAWPARASAALSKTFGDEPEVETAPGQATSPRVPDERPTPVDTDSLGHKAAELAARTADTVLRRDADTRRDDAAAMSDEVDASTLEAPRRPATTTRRGESVMASPLLTMPRVRHPQAIALFVHGGDVEGHLRMRRGDPAYLRIVPFARDVEIRSRGRIGAAVLRLAVRGWNEPEKPAVEDARWALGELGRRYPHRPIAVVGHSMGGRVALDVAGRGDVAALVALAPWAADAYDAQTFRDTPLLGIHGRRDTVTDPVATKSLVDAVAAVGGDARFVSMPGWHAMLWDAARWHRETSRFLIEHLLVDQDAGRRAR